MALTLTITMDLDDVAELLDETDSHELKIAIVAAMKGRPLADLPFDAWAQNWPVVDRDLNLTGEFRDSGSDDWLNYDDEAAILRDEAIEGGWYIDEDEGRAEPPK